MATKKKEPNYKLTIVQKTEKGGTRTSERNSNSSNDILLALAEFDGEFNIDNTKFLQITLTKS